MASIRRQIVIDADPDTVWDALRDWDALHYRLAAGFVTDTHRDGTARIVTFASGVTVREEILGCDEEHRRLAWSVVHGPYTHHNGAAEVLADTDGSTRFVWTADLRPDTLAEATARAMEDGLAAIKRTLESRATHPETAEVGIGRLAPVPLPSPTGPKRKYANGATPEQHQTEDAAVGDGWAESLDDSKRE